MSDHDHSHHNHSHIPDNERKIAIAAALTGLFMVAEIVGGVISGSLALIADAGHMLTDFAALILAWIAFRLARRPANDVYTYGYDRFSILAAFINGLSLFLVAIWICYEAYHRLSQPTEILGGLMLWIAFAGLLINVIVFWILTRGDTDNLNIRAAALHVAGDLLGSVAALLASLIIIFTGWTPIDPILSVLVALIILKSAWSIVKDAARILLEVTPRHFDRSKAIKAILTQLPQIETIDYFHVWSITEERSMATMKLKIKLKSDASKVKADVKRILKDDYKIENSTIEFS